MLAARVNMAVLLAVAWAVAGIAIAPRAIEAGNLLARQDDPIALADHAVARSLDAMTAAREIEAALAAADADLARSFLELARETNIPVAPELAERVERANAGAAATVRSLENFARGVVTGEAQDASGLAGVAISDLVVVGDIRDALREATRLAAGEEADQLVLGLACVGLAVTAGTYASVGAAVPARVGITVLKAARKTGRLGAAMAALLNHSLREVVDWTMLKGAVSRATLAQPAAALRGAREAVKVENARSLVRLVGDVGRVQASAGTRAALDGLKLAESPRDIAKIARLAAAKGGKTRAILKIAGRAAIVLTVGAFNLTMWLFWALVTLLGFVSSLKRIAERLTERSCRRRRLRRASRAHAHFISMRCVAAH
jgi:hypothetical protein